MKKSLSDRAERIVSNVKELSEEEKIKLIIKGIREAEKNFRDKYQWLKHQNVIGFSIFLFSLLGMIGCAAGYYYDVLPVWACIPLVAIFASLSHEIEHDLIHRLYFRKQPFMHNLMMLLVWVQRPNTVNPWYRRKIHILHHKTSGTPEDVEERLVGNGSRYGFMRFLVMFDGMLGTILRIKDLNTAEQFCFLRVMRAAFPLATLYFASWYVFLLFHGLSWGSAYLDMPITWAPWVESTMTVINFFVVVLIAPNVLRSFCLNFITSSMHYYGGVSNLLHQTQILKPWFLWPVQLFCFNFGSTHAIHHFVVGQPFYLRQMVAKTAHNIMREYGVRYNDLSTFLANNQYLSHPEIKLLTSGR